MPMNPVDAIVLVMLALGLLAGARAGLLGPVLGLAGALAGFALMLVAASLLHEQLQEIKQPARALAALLGVVAFVAIGETIGAAAGATISRRIRFSPLRPLDIAGGAVVGAAHVALLVWLLAALASSGVSPALGPAARDSVASRSATERLPPPGAVAGRILDLRAVTDLPGLFAGLEPAPAAPVDLPGDSAVAELAASAEASTAKVTSAGCGPGLSVGSGFFVSAQHAVTNAHVVAGGSTISVNVAGSELEAVVVAFDPSSDLALVYVPQAAAPALALSSDVPRRGTAAAALGYPGGGELTVTPAAVTATYDFIGPNIYGQGAHSHSVVELQAGIRRGNSGGPLVVAPGVVGAVVFGASTASADVGYAIGADAAREAIGRFIGATAPVDTGPCL